VTDTQSSERQSSGRQGTETQTVTQKPILIVFSSQVDGHSRRVEGYLAQVLQRRRNHETFSVRYVANEQRPDLLERFRIEETPTLVVLVDRRVRGRLARPRGCEEIQAFLAPWLR
jgi:thioredoxin-like negative regulator of GroEL